MRFLNFKLRQFALGAMFVAPFLLLATSPISAQDAKPDFAGAKHCACAIQTTNDNLGNATGYVVRLDIQYQDTLKPRWNHAMRMYRVEDRKKAGQFCLSMYKEYFKEEQKQFESTQKQNRRETSLSPNQQASFKSSLVPTF
jgi:hypothetical protein